MVSSVSSLGNLPPQPPRRHALPSRPAHRSYRYGSTAKAGAALMCYASSQSWYWRRPMKIGTPTSATTPSDSIDWLKAGYGNNPNSGCGCIDGGRYRTIQRAGASQQICARLSRDPLQNVISPADSPSAILRSRSPARFSILRLIWGSNGQFVGGLGLRPQKQIPIIQRLTVEMLYSGIDFKVI